MDHDATWYGGRPWPWPRCVRWGPSSPQRGTAPAPNFRPMSVMANGWMPPGSKVGLGPGNVVLDGDPAPPKKGTADPPLFGLCILWPCGWMDQDATWYRGRPWPRPHFVRWGPRSHQRHASQQPHTFAVFGRRQNLCPYKLWPMFIVAKRLDRSG